MPVQREESPGQRSSWYEQNHVDLGALRERVSGTERSITNLSDLVAANQRDTARQIESLQTSLSSQIRDMSISFAAARTTNWGTIIAAVGVVVVLGGAVLTPIMLDITQTAESLEKVSDNTVRKEVFQHNQDDQNAWLGSLRDRTRADEEIVNADRIALARLEGATAERHETYLRDHAVVLARIDGIEGNLIKRPEIESLIASNKDLINLTNAANTSRIDAVISSLNELRRDFGTNWTIGDTVREIQSRLNSLQIFMPPTPSAK